MTKSEQSKFSAAHPGLWSWVMVLTALGWSVAGDAHLWATVGLGVTLGVLALVLMQRRAPQSAVPGEDTPTDASSGSARDVVDLIDLLPETCRGDGDMTSLKTEELLQACSGLETRVIQVLQQVSMSAEKVELGSSSTLQAMCVTTERTSEAQDLSTKVQRVMTTLGKLTAAMSSSVGDIEHQTADTKAQANDAVHTAQATAERMQALSSSAAEIGDVVSFIRDVARQTRLLALNAAIEAERAGEAGRGFAVVADQVRALAQKTGDATNNIADQVNAIQSEVQAVTRGIEAIQSSVEGFETVTVSIASAVADQARATDRINSLVATTGRDIHIIDDSLQSMAQAILNTGDHAGESLKASALFRATGQELTKVVLAFLRELREGALGNRRIHPRYTSHPPLRVTAEGVEGDGLLLNLSQEGACFSLAQRLPANQPTLVHFDGLGSEQVEVVRFNGDQMGARFLRPISERPTFKAYLDTLSLADDLTTPTSEEQVDEMGDAELWL
ncbi:MAG: methyl-accepting chemotaxis protein [Bradymonadia bacterium]